MKLAVVVIGDGRIDYLNQTVTSVREHVLHPVSARIMVDDSGDLDCATYLDKTYPEFIHVHGGRRGMAGAVQAGFAVALEFDPDYVLWIEEDHLLIRKLPIAAAIQALEQNPRLAQMVFPREVCDPTELPDQLTAIVRLSAFSGVVETHTWYDYLFSMVPNLIPKRVLKLGWPAGPLGVGNEAGMTRRCLDQGYVFGAWGHPGDEPYVRHIGYASRTAGWAL